MTPRAFGLVPVLAATVLAAVVLSARPATAQQGWTTPPRTLSFQGIDAGGPQVAFDATGHGFAVWTQDDGVAFAVWRAEYVPAFDAWLIPEQLSPPGQWAQIPRIAMDSAGNALVVWIRWTDPVYELVGRRFVAAGQYWSAPVTIATIGEGGAGPALAITPGGDAIAIWTGVTSSAPVGAGIFAARYLAASNAWLPAVGVSSPTDFAFLADVALAPGGDAVAVWLVEVTETTEAIQTARFAAATGTWQTPVTRSAAGTFADDGAVTIDDAGNAVVAWQRSTLAETTRYDAGSDTWSAVTVVSVGMALEGPALATDADGNTVALWRVVGGGVEITRYDAGLDAWSTTQPLTGSLASDRPAVAVDPAGNAVAFWPSPALATGSGQGARFIRALGTWTAPETLATPGPPTMVAMAADGVGNVGVVWHSNTATPAVHATRWSGAPRAPVITGLTATTAAVTVSLTPPVTTEPAFWPTAYEYSISIGPWTRVPPSSPLVITGLQVGTWYLSVRAVNAAGGGASAGAPFSIAPDPPSHLAAVAVDGNRVTLAWQVPPGATSSFTYVVEGGLAPGEVLASLPTGSPAPTFTFTAPPGVFRVRVRTDYFQLRSAPSNEIVLGVDVRWRRRPRRPCSASPTGRPSPLPGPTASPRARPRTSRWSSPDRSAASCRSGSWTRSSSRACRPAPTRSGSWPPTPPHEPAVERGHADVPCGVFRSTGGAASLDGGAGRSHPDHRLERASRPARRRRRTCSSWAVRSRARSRWGAHHQRAGAPGGVHVPGPGGQCLRPQRADQRHHRGGTVVRCRARCHGARRWCSPPGRRHRRPRSPFRSSRRRIPSARRSDRCRTSRPICRRSRPPSAPRCATWSRRPTARPGDAGCAAWRHSETPRCRPWSARRSTCRRGGRTSTSCCGGRPSRPAAPTRWPAPRTPGWPRRS
ncbi:MAG: hypothetical protein R2708_04835 [Vicinamibacterales bacterium]